MDKTATLETIRRTGLVPVVRARSSEEALRAIEAIRKGGVSIIEITMTVPGAVDLIGEVTGRAPDVLVGAGTVLDPDTARACISAGARFVVSPALDPDTIAACRDEGVAVFPGALTPTEVVAAWRAGADIVKVFPAGAVGGPAYIKSLRAPLPQIELLPTGGVNLQTAGDFLRAGAVALGVGADLVDLAALRRGEDDVLTDKARQYVEVVRASRAKP
jgi:2-dehydro-3-deoxyphosphogluconate aldolase / (4S)-4-hydroxy-2-oxoglutarate aldolase